MKDRLRRWEHVRSELGVDPVRSDDDVGFSGGTVGEGHAGDVACLLESDAAMAAMNDACRQGRGEELDEISPVHAERSVPSQGVGDLYRGDRPAVVTEVLGLRADARTPPLNGWAEADSLQVTNAVRREENSGTNLVQRLGLLVHRYSEAVRDERVGGEQAADPAPDEHHMG